MGVDDTVREQGRVAPLPCKACVLQEEADALTLCVAGGGSEVSGLTLGSIREAVRGVLFELWSGDEQGKEGKTQS